MNVLDIGIILLLVMFAIVGFKNGVIREVVSIVGIIIVFVVAFSLKEVIGNFLCYVCPFFKLGGVLEGITAINILLYQTIAFLIIYSVLMVIYTLVLKISKGIQKILDLTIILWLPSKLLGALVGLLEGIIVMFIIIMILTIPLKNTELFQESQIVHSLLYDTPILSNSTSNYTSSVEEIYELEDEVSKKKITSQEANEKTIKIMIKYNIVTKDFIKELIKLKKLDIDESILE